MIDLYQVHWPNPVVPLSATMRPLARLQRDGLIRHVGVSQLLARPAGGGRGALGCPVLSNQVRYNLVDRRIERELLGWAQQHDRLVIAYSPLQQGCSLARYGPDTAPRACGPNTPDFLPENLRRSEPLLDVLRRVADAHGATPAQVSLAWLLRRPNVVVIPGLRRRPRPSRTRGGRPRAECGRGRRAHRGIRRLRPIRGAEAFAIILRGRGGSLRRAGARRSWRASGRAAGD